MPARSILTVVVLLGSIIGVAQTPSAPPSPESRGVVRLRAKFRTSEALKGVARKRFFLIKGSLEENDKLVQSINARPIVSRDCYYRAAGASEALIKWLQASDCESVYCREIQTDDVSGPNAVPEFVDAVASGEKELGSRDLARKWLTTNLPEKLRDGFYKTRQAELDALLKQSEASSGAPVLSVMTDRNGTAYFTDLVPGTYTLSNILGTEIGSTSAVWNCDIRVKPGDLATEKPFLISNRANKDKNVKCYAVEKPLPTCDVVTKPN
jgi:hypothetical protein